MPAAAKTATASDGWLETTAEPAPTEETQLSFFGLRPPIDRRELEARVAQKRQYWNKQKGRCPNPEGKRRAAYAVQVIQAVSKALLYGTSVESVAHTNGSGAEILSSELRQLWELIERLLSLRKLGEALRIAERTMKQEPYRWDGHAMFGYVVAVGAGTGQLSSPIQMEQGLRALKRAIAIDRSRPEPWVAAAELLLGMGRFDEVLVLRDSAAKEFRAIPQPLIAAAASARLSTGDVDLALIDVARAVAAAPDDSGLRGYLAEALISRAAVPMLPINSAEGMRRYGAIVATAAWCAAGVPEAESLVRPHRMWATLGPRPLFVGSSSWRALIAFFTGCLWPVLYNPVRSRPAWRILFEGNHSSPQFQLLVQAEFVRDAHARRARPFSWDRVGRR